MLSLMTLAACGPEGTFQARTEGGGTEPFVEFVTELHGPEPLDLATCSTDPTPEIFDDETWLCVHVRLDPAGLSAAGERATLPIEGEARVAEAVGPTPPTFNPASGHSPVVLAAWVAVRCYEGGRHEGPFIQQLQGRLELEKNNARRLRGRVVLTADGQVEMDNCGDYIGAEFDFPFDVARP
jgi:hypothetical protein